MKEKEQDREGSRPKYERDDKEHGLITGKPPNQDHGQPKNKRPPPDPANFEHNGDPPPLDHNNNADVVERDIGVEQFSMPKSLISELDEKLSRPTSLSSKDGQVPLPDVEGDIMQAVEMSTTDLSGSGEQFSMPKSLTSQLDKILFCPFQASRSSNRVSRRYLSCIKFTRASGVQCGRELQKLRMEVDCLKANADKRGTVPWQIYVYDDLKKTLVGFMACLIITIVVGYVMQLW
ncbi:uncharacterized protein LOC115922366 [Strongylocentrotus purpuratus]|uniref:Uncharacterized protein n=1 Tax=Strongylocentrotus purpuratus TaxID=7668 RepID=A0A7M7NKX9_STRPU|nr:uncharacterized protein LOC115922366 [Strongylocentrotus purpuratus]